MKYQKGFVGIIILIIVALSAIGGGYYVYHKQQNKLTPTIFEPQSNKQTNSNDTSVVATKKDETQSNISLMVWKSYTSQDGTFKFSYPENWYLSNAVKDVIAENTMYSWKITNYEPTLNTFGIGDGQIKAEFSVICDPSRVNRTIDDVMAQCKSNPPENTTRIECIKTNIGGRDYKRVISKSSSDIPNAQDTFFFAVSTHKGECDYTMLSYVLDDADKKVNLDMLEQISNTFEIK